MATKIPVDETADNCLGTYGCGPEGNVAEADLDRVEVVGGAELGRETGSNHAVSSEVYGAEYHEESGFLFKEDSEGSEEAWALLVLDSRVRHRDVILAELSLVEVSRERDVPSLRGDGTVSDDVAACFGHEEKDSNQHNSGIDIQEPEDRSPAQEVCQETTDDGPKCGTKRLSHRC